ncbi:thiamine pyrophosphate-dependent enzyme [Aneurinibacillus tyrosinisolvens]|uniref:thiamine pyrophosphate-dependent enzyme n=1 Tax=Aneurinibacillus tyrosinisolvens TaxID=1443435 RepID=UPI00063FA9F0|nr:thiamine pyrophosphate-dependent enzyme [Aneurinibacillus tyrosinisolvens]
MEASLTLKDYSNGNKPTWCPGCGDFTVLNGIQRALLNLAIPPEDTVLVSGIGCSGKISHYFGGYSIHSTHGRALAIGQGVKGACPDLTVLVAGGDGDGYGIGVGHLVHAARRNLPITYIVMDNGVYGNTKGQTSPTSPIGYESSTTPLGNHDVPINPLLLAWSSGASFIAQGFSGDIKHLTHLIMEGIQHDGFSLINVFSPCVVFNKAQGYDFYREKTTYQDSPAATPHDYIRMLNESPMPLGILWKTHSENSELKNRKTFDDSQLYSFLHSTLK